MKLVKLITLLILLNVQFSSAQDIALLKYNGGGDWYANPTSLTNLIAFCNKNINTTLTSKYKTVDVESLEINEYPFVHMTGHGNVVFNSNEIENLRTYLQSGGFLHIDDNYGMDKYLHKEMIKLFPNQEPIELPATHPIFSAAYQFTNGLPKIHEHDGKRPQAFGWFYNGRLVCLYTTECDLGDGWEDPEVHHDPEDVRQKALKMGANIIKYVFNH